MPETGVLRSIRIDLATNTLRLVLHEPDADAHPVSSSALATIDIGTGGRLVGLELAGGTYIDVMPAEPKTEHLMRSTEACITVVQEAGSESLLAVVVPRRGAGYEITYPSGNQ
jgi:hypothetical protein